MEKVAKTAFLGICINGLVFGIKYFLAFHSGSIALETVNAALGAIGISVEHQSSSNGNVNNAGY